MKRAISIVLFCLCSLLASIQVSAQTKIIKGGSQYGDVLYNFDGTALRSGSGKYSDVLYNWDGDSISLFFWQRIVHSLMSSKQS